MASSPSQCTPCSYDPTEQPSPPVLQVSTSRTPLVSGALSLELATVPRALPRPSRALSKASSKSEARSFLPFAHEACHPPHLSGLQAVPDIIPPPVPDTAAGTEAVGTFCLVPSVADLDDDSPIPLLGWNRDMFLLSHRCNAESFVLPELLPTSHLVGDSWAHPGGVLAGLAPSTLWRPQH